MKKSKSYRSQLFRRRILALFMVLVVGTGGYKLTHFSSAATGYNHNATGFINSCGLDPFARTVIYGWAYDADTGNNAFPKAQINVGGSVIVAYTDQANYNEGKINAYLRANRPNTPITGTYGFAAVFGQLTKGSTYAVSGVALNEGTGSNTTLNMDSVAANGDGVTGGTQLTASWTLPDACLGLTPPPTGGGGGGGGGGGTQPPPADTKITVCDLQTKQIVTILQSQYNSTRYSTNLNKCAATPVTPPPTGGGGTGGSGGTHSTTSNSTASDTGNGGKADATVGVGTLSASVSVPASGATTMYLLYGTSPENLDSSTEDTTVAGDKVDFVLPDLQPKTGYHYQIVRTDAASAVTSSPDATFDTAGYGVTVHFQDDKNKAVKDIKAVIDNADKTEAKSDKDGNLKFFDLDPGTYTVTFEYKNLTYTRDFDTDEVSSDASSSGKIAVLSDTVNVSTLKNGSAAPLPTQKHSAVLKVILLLLMILAIGGAIVWLLLRRRRMNLEAQYGGYGVTSTSGSVDPGVIDMPTAEAQQFMPPPAQVTPDSPATPAVPIGPDGQPLEHVGESLREMVIRSMHEEAQKRKTNDPTKQP